MVLIMKKSDLEALVIKENKLLEKELNRAFKNPSFAYLKEMLYEAYDSIDDHFERYETNLRVHDAICKRTYSPKYYFSLKGK